MTFLMTLLLNSFVHADCKNSIEVNNQVYCYEVQWQKADQKTKGKLEPVNQMSPVLIPMKQPPQKWLYSKASIKFWNKSDNSKAGVQIENFTVLPFMYMDSGHNHSTSHKVSFENGSYKLKSMALHKMTGCWTINWKFNDKNQGPLLWITEFSNLSEQEIKEIKKHCLKKQ